MSLIEVDRLLGVCSRVTVNGGLDEWLEAAALTQGVSPPVVYDLGGVNRINSVGVRLWMEGLQKLPQGYCCFVRVRPALVAQFNVIARFGESGEVLSFYAPCLCTRCHQSFDVLVDAVKHDALLKALQLPPVECPHCEGVGELDDVAESFLLHLSKQPRPNPPDVVRQALSETSSVP